MSDQYHGPGSTQAREVTIFDVWDVLWAGKWLVIAISAICSTIAVVYALTATEWYRAESVLVPADDQGMTDLGGQLGGLAALAGIRPGDSGTTSEALAIVVSREFARDFIIENDLAPAFTEGEVQSSTDSDLRDAVRFFHETVLKVNEDRETGQVTIGAEWTDPYVAAEWANTLVSRLNQRMRERALNEAETNIKFLREEIAANNVLALEQSLSRVLESEMQKFMVARGNEEYAFKVIDSAEAPLKRSRPRRTLLVLGVAVASGFFGIIVVFFRASLARARREEGARA